MNLFVLTPEEKRVVAFVMLMILVGVCVKEYRKRHPVPPTSIEVQKHPWIRKLPPLPSATPQASDAAGPTTSRPKRSRKTHKRTPAATPSADEEADSSANAESERPP